MFCSSCGNEIPQGGAFCTFCGTKAVQELHPAAPTTAVPQRSVREVLEAKTGKFSLKMNKGAISLAEGALLPGEVPLYAIIANASLSPTSRKVEVDTFSAKGKVNGVLVVTDKRVLFCASTLGSSDMKQIPIDAALTFELTTLPLVGGKVRIVGMNGVLDIDIQKPDGQELVSVLSRVQSAKL